jgi:hypothetical protein
MAPSDLLVYQAATYVLGAGCAVLLPLYLLARRRAASGRGLVLMVIGRAVQHLNARGVSRDRAVQMVAPELVAALAKQGKIQKG